MKKKLVAILLSISIAFTFSITVFGFSIEESIKTDIVGTTEVTMTETEISNSIELIEDDLLSNGTDVVTELKNQISRYEKMLEDAEPEEYNQIEHLIITTEELISDYKAYQSSGAMRGSFHLIYSPAVATVIAYFNAKDYDLSAELLTHAKENDDLDSIYTPILQDDVLSSSVFNSIKNGTIYEGTKSFPNSGTTNDEDLYYAIHSFHYSKSKSGNVIVIQDRYDFKNSGYTSIGSTAISVMYAAQEAGVLVPYYSVITQDFVGVCVHQSETLAFSSTEKYFEKKVTLGKDEHKEFNITFSAEGSKVFQTFGNKDTYLYLYDSKGNLLASNDDSGYEHNAFIKYYCYANTQYVLKVEFLFFSESGELKLAITPSFGALKSDSTNLNTYEDIFNTTSSNYTFHTFSQSGYVRLFTYTPSQTGYYTVETEGDIDTYIYLIDPRSTYYVVNGEGYDDDSGEIFNASIYRELADNIPYLIIYSRYVLTGEDSNFSLRIYAD
ncbi:MAG: hypothetical protein J6Q50_02150 [Clostridia bacterium]|nr:hypothetical protein [Clostridia bacterium]